MPKVSANERAATRARLVEASKREFAARGLNGARFDEISLAAGHAKGTIYNYFGSKEELFFTVLADWCTLLCSAFDPTHLSAAEQLVEIARLDTEIARKDPDLARVVGQHMPSLMGSHAAAVEAAVAPLVELTTTVCAAGMARDELTSPHGPLAVARLFLTTLSSFQTEALLPEPTIQLDDVAGLIHQHFISGLTR